MRVNANAVLRSWTILAAFGGSYAPGITYTITDGGADKGSNVGGIAGGTIVAIIAVLAIVGIAVCIVAWLQK